MQSAYLGLMSCRITARFSLIHLRRFDFEPKIYSIKSCKSWNATHIGHELREMPFSTISKLGGIGWKGKLRLDSIKLRNLYFFLPLNVLNPRLLNFLGHVNLNFVAELFFVPTLPWIFLWHPSSLLVARLLNDIFRQSAGKKLSLYNFKDASNCLEKVKKISHFNQTN